MNASARPGRVRATLAESGVLRAIRNVLSAVQALGPDVNERAWTLEVDSLQSDLAESRVVRAVAAPGDAAGRAWATSAARTFVTDMSEAYRRLTGIERVRMAGVWAVTAAFTIGILGAFDPRPVSAARWALWAGFLALGAAAAAWAGPATAAWTEWNTRRAFQRRARESA